MREPICWTCKSLINIRAGEVCRDGFITGQYPTGIPQCMMDDFPDYSAHFNKDGSPKYYNRKPYRSEE